jgi:hypothetical protein
MKIRDCFIARTAEMRLSSVVIINHILVDGVTFNALGGGFVYKLDKSTFDQQFRNLSPQELTTLMAAFEVIDIGIGENDGHITGVSNGESWNGWACPYVSADVIEAAMGPGGYLHSQGFHDLVRFYYIPQTNDMLEIEEDGDGLSELTEADIKAIADLALQTPANTFEFRTAAERTILVQRCEKIEVPVGDDAHYRIGSGWCWEEENATCQNEPVGKAVSP